VFLIRYLVILIIPVLAYIGLRKLAIRYSLSQKQFNLLLLLATVLIVVLVLILLGRIPPSFILAPLMVAGTFMLRYLPLLFRLLPLWNMFKTKTRTAYGSSGAQDTSSIRTRYLLMTLHHESADMDGEVLEGQFKGQTLSNLSVEQLLLLANECRQDGDSLQVLEAYLDRCYPNWRENNEGFDSNAEPDARRTSEQTMDRAMALEILGLSEGAGTDEIVQAHRRLMQKMHPDRGGSDFLAKKINAARDFLLD
jgi:hypothetical protein